MVGGVSKTLAQEVLAVTGTGALPIMEELKREAARYGQRAGFGNLDDMEPIKVVACIESHKDSAATLTNPTRCGRMFAETLRISASY